MANSVRQSQYNIQCVHHLYRCMNPKEYWRISVECHSRSLLILDSFPQALPVDGKFCKRRSRHAQLVRNRLNDRTWQCIEILLCQKIHHNTFKWSGIVLLNNDGRSLSQDYITVLYIVHFLSMITRGVRQLTIIALNTIWLSPPNVRRWTTCGSM